MAASYYLREQLMKFYNSSTFQTILNATLSSHKCFIVVRSSRMSSTTQGPPSCRGAARAATRRPGRRNTPQAYDIINKDHSQVDLGTATELPQSVLESHNFAEIYMTSLQSSVTENERDRTNMLLAAKHRQGTHCRVASLV